MPRHLTRDQILRTVQYMIKSEEDYINIEMGLIERSGFAPDVVDRSVRLNKSVVVKETLEKLLKEIKDLEQ